MILANIYQAKEYFHIQGQKDELEGLKDLKKRWAEKCGKRLIKPWLWGRLEKLKIGGGDENLEK